MPLEWTLSFVRCDKGVPSNLKHLVREKWNKMISSVAAAFTLEQEAGIKSSFPLAACPYNPFI